MAGERVVVHLGFGHHAMGHSRTVSSTTEANDDARLVRITSGGPLMIQGPVRIELPDGSTVESDRFMVAICTCKRSKTFPLCDTSHRQRSRHSSSEPSA